MRSLRGLLGLLLLPSLLLPLAAPRPGITLRPEDKRTLLYLHNLYRQKPVPQAAYMLKMYWDEDLAVFAKGYAQNCTWAHNPQRGWRGENLFTSTGMELNLPLAVEEWFREIEFFNFSTNTCQPDQMCGHYTQVVWADSRLVGCGVHFCDFMHGIDERDMLMVVCNYQPPGNVRGRLPYKPGQPCSLCPPGTRCVDTLCEPITGPEEAQDLPSLVTEASSSLATEASAARKMGPPASPATGTPTFLPTDMPASLATQALPTIESEAPSSLATRGPPSMATDAPSSSTTDAPSFLTTANLLSPDEASAPVPRSTPTPAPQATGRVAGRTRAPSVRPERFRPPETSPTEAQKSLPHAQGKAQAGGSHKLPRSGELLASVSPAQDEPLELQATPVPVGRPSSRSLPSFPDASASTQAVSGHALALRSSRPDTQVPEEPGANLGIQPVMEPDSGPGAGTGTGTGAGTGLESGAGTDSGTGLESGAGTGVGTDSGTSLESGAGTGAGTDSGTGLESGAGTGAGTDSGTGLESGAGTGVGTDSGTSLESGVGTDSGTGLESGAGTDSGTGLESGAGTGIGSGTESAAGSDAETNLELGIGAGTQPDAGPDLGVGAGPDSQAGAVGNPDLEKPSRLKTTKGKPGKGKPGKLKSGSCPGPVWSALLGLLLPPLALAGNF